jgi:hypothetical protein
MGTKKPECDSTKKVFCKVHREARGMPEAQSPHTAEKWLTDICEPLFCIISPKVPQNQLFFKLFGDV